MKKILLITSITFLLVGIGSISSKAQVTYAGTERIHEYNAEIDVNEDGTLHVVEEIVVNSEHQSINHGIYRDYPTLNSQYWLFYDAIDFDILSVKRDGSPEPYVIEALSGGKRVKIGSADRIVSRGIHTYELEYTVSEQLRYFNDHDELFYNITGNGWEFPIDEISATITLPFEISKSDLNSYAYTGFEGEKGTKYEVKVTEGKGSTTVQYDSTSGYDVGEGMTIVIEWPKDYVDAVGNTGIIQDIIVDNLFVLVAIVGAFLLLIYYFLAWFIKGRDPVAKTIFPEFKPPVDLSPSEVRYIDKMGYDNKSVTAAIVNMAVNGLISIKETKKKFTIIREANTDVQLSKAEMNLFEMFFNNPISKISLAFFGHNIFSSSNEAETKDSLTFSSSNSRVIQPAITKFRSDIKSAVENNYLRNNSIYLIIGIFIHALCVGLVILNSFIHGEYSIIANVGMIVFWNSITYLFVFSVMIPLWVDFFKTKQAAKFVAALFLTGFLTPFILIGIAIIFIPAEGTQGLSVLAIFPILLPLVLHFSFFKALKARTVSGRELQDSIEGFKMFLKTTEKERIKLMHKELPLTLDNYEKYLPYAIALDIEAQWAELFSATLAEAQVNGHTPNWYSGTNIAFSSSNFSSSLSSSLSSSISSSSSSGSGGGSGGGGGGGGGGGW